jgi:hypothetical protein
MKMYCVRCKKEVEVGDKFTVNKTKNGKTNIARSNCPLCGMKMVRFVKG